MGNHFDAHKCALLAKGKMAIDGRKQEPVAKAIGKTLVLLNLYLNRKINFLDSDIELLLTELDVVDVGKKLSKGGRYNKYEERKKNILEHIALLEKRYTEEERQLAVNALNQKLELLENEQAQKISA